MPHLYLVLSLLGNVVFSVGPWPDSAMETCKETATTLQHKARGRWLEFQDIAKTPVTPDDIVGDCIYSKEAPPINDAVRLN